MASILTDLYHLLAPQMQSEGEQLIAEQNKDLIERIERQISEQDLSSYKEIQAKLSMRREEEAFSMGFRLAVQILTATRGEPPAPRELPRVKR